ncbi:hypothetical protein OEB99_04175 [Actinotalea sp. M2MS4P-6]|uniref:hypothetical protein n=1 Tax=Actinotalea sp. M2MS4P-6 TaxID=2983762 RepID=UPI0021E3CA90|nr:hypothetical protein [Actinotalea sp. M2MS4P-6]MCV2393496.1 hypothetical protein [Actinotalea sp. M2MS4P-6]
MAWQLTSIVRRVQRLFGAGGPSAPAPLVATDPAVLRAAQVRDGLRPDERRAYDTWVADRPEASLVLARVLAGTGRLAPVAEIATAWGGWDADVQAAVADPVHHLTKAGTQTDQTTCGSSSLLMLAAAGDPVLAAWLAAGWLGEHRPPELSGADDRALAVLAERPPAARFGVLQKVLHRRSNRGALGPLAWPQSLGTPPWGVARLARYPGVTYGHHMVDDSDRLELADVLASVAGWVGRGVPVPLFAGGDTGGGLQAAVPRHVVLAVGTTSAGLEVFEPSSGRVLTLAGGSTGPRPALGGWSHLVWAVLPR